MQEEHWTEVIRPKTGLLDLNLKEVWRYRDLLALMVKRDFISNYKQTILGPLWLFIQPLLTTLIYVIIFGVIARIPTAGIPPLLFYLSGVTLWNYFAVCFSSTATVFRDNASIFGKVYFPRLIMPLSIVTSNLVRLCIQLLLFILFWVYYYIKPDTDIHITPYVLLLPVLIGIMAALALGFGLIISSMTNKYKDLVYLLAFGIQLAMYATPVIYPVDIVPEKYRWIITANPMSGVIETFRTGLLGTPGFNSLAFFYSLIFSIVILLIGVITFNKVEKSFMDTV